MGTTIKSHDDILRQLIKHNSMLSGYIYSIVESWSIVEEALQETAVYMCNRWQDFEAGTNFGAWARTVARLRSLEILRRENRQHKIAVSVSETIPDNTWDEYGDCNIEHKQALTECLKQLPDKHRRILDMKYKDRQACGMIADILKKSIESIYMTLTRIRQFLKKCVEHKLSGETV